MNKEKIITTIYDLQSRFLRASHGKESLLRMLYESEVPEHVYNSNAIENSTLTLDETDRILNEIDLDRYINQRELFEAKNLARVVEYIQNNAEQKNLSFEVILFLHKMLMSNINDDIAGRWRNENEWVRVGSHIAADPKNILSLLTDMMLEYRSSIQENIISRIAKFHLQFENIHPFCDGNGRMGRVLNNYLLLRDGFVPINIKFTDRAEYYKAFKEFDESGKIKIMETIVGRAMAASYHKRLAYLEGKEIILLSEYAAREKISHSNLLNKAKRQTIEAFMEKGKWKIGV